MNWVTIACSDVSGRRRFLETFRRYGQDGWRLLACMYKPYFRFPRLEMEPVVIKTGKPWPGQPTRYSPLIEFAREHSDDMFLCLDVDDVVFQEPMIVDKGENLLLAGEGVDLKDAPYWQPMLRESDNDILNREVVNAGSYCARGWVASDLWGYIERETKGKPHAMDQIAFMHYVWKKHKTLGIHITKFLMCLYDNIRELDVKCGVFVERYSGFVPPIIHGNGSMQKILDVVCPK